MAGLLLAALAILLATEWTLANDNICNCRCKSRSYVCDELKSIKTEVDVNTADRRKWNRHFQFVQKFHYGWEDEIEKILEQKMEKTPKSGTSSSKQAKLYEMLLKSQDEFQRKLFDLEARLQVAETRAEKLDSDLQKEKESVKLLQSQSTERELSMDAENQILTQKIEFLKGKLYAVETTTMGIQTELEKEREARSKIKDKVDGMLPSLNVFNPANFTRNLKDLQVNFGSFGQKLESLENQGLAQGYEIYKDKKNIKKLQSSLSRFQSAAMKATDSLLTVMPAHVAESLRKYQRELEIEKPEEKETYPISYRNFTTHTFLSNPLVEMSSKLEDLESNMEILRDSIRKAESDIKSLESKYNEALRSPMRPKRPYGRGRDYELVEPHRKPDTLRPFDSRLDP